MQHFFQTKCNVFYLAFWENEEALAKKVVYFYRKDINILIYRSYLYMPRMYSTVSWKDKGIFRGFFSHNFFWRIFARYPSMTEFFLSYTHNSERILNRFLKTETDHFWNYKCMSTSFIYTSKTWIILQTRTTVLKMPIFLYLQPFVSSNIILKERSIQSLNISIICTVDSPRNWHLLHWRVGRGRVF
jgi:hypothetical protein